MFFNILIISYFLIIINDFTNSTNCHRVSYPIANVPTKISSSTSPAKLTIKQAGSEVNVFISNERENFTLVLFANPFIKVKPLNGCPPLNTSDYNTRRYYKACNVSKDAKSNSATFFKISTGCYYFIMITDRNERWDVIDFYETSYHHLNRRIKLKNDWDTKPQNQDSSMELKLIFEIPLDCIIVAVDVYEISQTTNSTSVDIIKSKKYQESQSCRIRTNSTTNSVGGILIENITATVSTSDDHTEGDPWEVHLTWANLTRGCGRHYYLKYSNTDLEDCKHEYGADDIEAWELMKTQIAVDLGNPCAIEIPPTSSGPEVSPWIWIGCGLGGFIFIIIVFYCIWMRRKFPGPFCKKNGSYGIPALPSKPMRPIDGNEQPAILLMYERGFPPAEELKTFKRCLKQICRGYKIRDVYASSEFKYLEDVKKWIGEKLTAGSKVIWFDTPQLRSRLNDIEKYQTIDDFRDQAVPHAVALAKSLFQDTNTQYRRHFVVWWEGYEVDDRHGPFQLISPHVRYRLPGQTTELCDHLNSSMESPKNNEELELDS